MLRARRHHHGEGNLIRQSSNVLVVHHVQTSRWRANTLFCARCRFIVRRGPKIVIIDDVTGCRMMERPAPIFRPGCYQA